MAAGRARGAHALLGRPGGVHRRPFLHPLSGCPSLTIKPSEDPLRTDPVAHVNNDCVGCGLCGEVAHAAQLCPSLRADRHHPESQSPGTGCVRRSRAALHAPARRTVDAAPTVGQTSRPPCVAGRSDPDGRGKAHTALIAALGGEGGGVLASWLHQRAAVASGLACSRTSIPGVAQRTGATTYYLEMVPDAGARHGTGRRVPCWRSMPRPARSTWWSPASCSRPTRAMQAGFVTPDRTLLVASIGARLHHRREGRHGRWPARRAAHGGAGARFSQAARRCRLRGSRRSRRARSMPCCWARLPPPACCRSRPRRFRAAIRAEGRPCDANLRGFEAGLNRGRDPVFPQHGRRGQTPCARHVRQPRQAAL